MTIVVDEIGSDESCNVDALNRVRCSWCGETIETDGNVLAVSMCPDCHAKMLADFQKAQRQPAPSPHASDR